MRIALVGPLPPPSGGMANQTEQLARLLSAEGISVKAVQVNVPYRPRWIEGIRGVRALARLLPYLVELWRTAGQAQLFHVMANSGWSWHLYAAPAVWIASLRGRPVLINYRGGEAQSFFARSFSRVENTLKRADAIVVPSAFLQQVFASHGVAAMVIPNIIDLERFNMRGEPARDPASPHLIVTRNLEAIYDIETAIRAFARVKEAFPGTRLTVAGSGPERQKLELLAANLNVARAVVFTGRLDNDQMAELYRDADVMVNSSLIDNMPISILESLASGVPVVSTNVGGIPYLVEHEKSALLVAPGAPEGLAQAIVTLLRNPTLADALVREGLKLAQTYSWDHVGKKWLALYFRLARLDPAPVAANDEPAAG